MTLDFDIYADATAMREPLQLLPSLDGAPIRRIVVLHAARRAPRRNPASRACRLAVCYGVETGTRSAQILYGKVYPREVCSELSKKAGGERLPMWLREINMLVWRFPEDPGLPQLGTLLDGSTELIRYRPEERATLRRADEAHGTVYAKTFRAEEGAQLSERFSHLARLSATAGAFDVAPPIRYDRASRTFWQRGVDAPALAATLTAANCAALMQLVAAGLARLHTAEPRFGEVRGFAELAGAALTRAAKIARCMPELAAAARRIAIAIAAHAVDFVGTPLVQIHGDFHLDQMRVGADRLFVFDLDELAIGDPLEDLASFVVKCRLESAPLAARACVEVIDAYARCRPTAFDPRRLDWHLAVQWLHKASRAYVFQRPGWRAAAAQMLAEAAGCAARLARSSA
jgi:phosphotransferase family enzyme